MRLATVLVAGTAVVCGAPLGIAEAGQTLDAIKEKGFIQCGVSTGLAGFSNPDDAGHWSGIDVDVCRAVAAALFGDAGAVRYTPLTAKERFTALQSGEVDLLSRNTTWTLTRDTALGLDFTGVTYYDGQGFMVPKSLGVKSALELDGASVCVQPGTTTELNLADFFRANNMSYEPVVIERLEEVRQAYDQGRCDVYTTDQSGLYAERTVLSHPDDHIILPEVISKEPLGPAVRHGDQEWGDVVRWSLYAMLEAEEYGVNSQNVDDLKANSNNPVVRRLLGTEGEMGHDLGVPADFGYQVIKQVGNYGEIFEANLGQSTPLKIERGLNALWNQGGLQYAMPVR
ncbi:MAG TPA: amino acid ABC transporter substrate-binding protein [Geminicoccaceae bacterium]|nr:amino acid ABC transporter substrate-binding protein [Geminicoccaceae bacterium]